MTTDEAAAALIADEASRHREPWDLWATGIPDLLSSQLDVRPGEANVSLRRVALTRMGARIEYVRRPDRPPLAEGALKNIADYNEQILVPGTAG